MANNSLITRIKHAWNVFLNRDPTESYNSIRSSLRLDRTTITGFAEKTMIGSIFTKIAVDVASLDFKHVKYDPETQKMIGEVHSSLNYCLRTEANIDQVPTSFFRDIVLTMLEDGCVAIVPIETSSKPKRGSSYNILSMRVGKILEWHPETVKVRVYNELKGIREDIILPKWYVGIIENPLYAIINEPNSTMKRLARKLQILDILDEKSSNNKLDLILQLPYVVKTSLRKQQAMERTKELEDQLANSQYGIGYTDGTERVIQLNRPVENNLIPQINYLTEMLFSQLGLTQDILNGTANNETMLNYYTRTIDPIAQEIVLEMKRKFLSKTARTQGQSIIYYRNPFRLVPITSLAEIADKMTRNEIMSANEIRSIVGLMPSDDPKADKLQNSNMPHENEDQQNQNEEKIATENIEERSVENVE